MIDFADRVAVVTGAGGGLGRAHALLLASRGAAVVVNDIGGDVHGRGDGSASAEKVVEEIRNAGGVAIANTGSVAEPEAAEAMIEDAVAHFGRIDIVVNNAGILRDKSFANLEWPDLHDVLEVHLRGAFYVTQPAFRHMKKQRYGRIVFTSSASGLFGNFGQSNYAAAKMGLVGLTRVLAIEGQKDDIKVNAIAPIALTRMTADLLGDAAEAFDPEYVSPVVGFFASAECQLTGEVWSVGGGSVSRVFVGLTEGIFKASQDGALTIEDIATNVADIRDDDGYIVPFSSQDEFAKLGPKLI